MSKIISVLRQKLVINCATHAEANLGVLAFKTKVLRQKLFIICATRAGANLLVLTFKIRVLRKKIVIISTLLKPVISLIKKIEGRGWGWEQSPYIYRGLCPTSPSWALKFH